MNERAIVDTNVLIAANGQKDCPQATTSCCLKAAQALRHIQQQGQIVIDDQWLILNEYKHKVNPSGQPGLGDSFLKWVLTNLKNMTCVEQVKITPKGNSFAEFPADPELATFDPSDHKFVAVAIVAKPPPPILNATDSDWANHYKELTSAGITIQFLCPDVVTPQHTH